MEGVLEIYSRTYDPLRPLVCMDEVPKQLLAETRDPLPAQPGKPARYDYECKRAGVSSLFMFSKPLSSNRHIEIKERRTRQDWAHVMRKISDTLYPEEEKIVVVFDNLNTHTPASFSVALVPDEARRLINRFEFHYTPKHDSWLNKAKMELSVLSQQCLDRHIPDGATISKEVHAWVDQRNANVVKVQWQFTTANARINLRSLYPKIDV